MAPEIDILKDLILELAKQGEWDEIRLMLTAQHPADLADIISAADEETREKLFSLLTEEIKPDVLAELESHVGSELLESLTDAEISDLVEEMEPDDAADLLSDLAHDRSQEILKGMEIPESREVRKLLSYEEDSAGGIMTPHLVRFDESQSVAQAIDQLAYVDIDEPFYNLYIVDASNRLCGVIELWELLRKKDKHARLGDVADRDYVTVRTDMDQEDVAQLMTKYDLTSIPVVDDSGKLVGRITVDDVMDVMEEEASEDILRMGGTSDEALFYRTPFQTLRTRLPWLLITLATGFVTSFLFREFMDHLEQVLVLSFFVPIVMAMGGNTGIQSSTLVIRRIALGTLEEEGWRSILGREIGGAFLMGLVCGTVICLWATFLVHTTPDQTYTFSPLFLGAIVGLSLLSAMVFAAVFGAFTPILLKKFNIDPAVASGPFVTSSNDIFALLIYYGVTFGLISATLRLAGSEAV